MCHDYNIQSEHALECIQRSKPFLKFVSSASGIRYKNAMSPNKCHSNVGLLWILVQVSMLWNIIDMQNIQLYRSSFHRKIQASWEFVMQQTILSLNVFVLCYFMPLSGLVIEALWICKLCIDRSTKYKLKHSICISFLGSNLIEFSNVDGKQVQN